MTRSPCPRRRQAWCASLAVAWAIALPGLVAPSAAQNLDLPALDLTVEPLSQRVVVRWTEAEDTAGRAVTGVTFAGFDSIPANNSDVSIEGVYALQCDYRLRITKIPQDPGFNRRLLLLSQIFSNTTGTGAPLRTDTLRIATADSLHLYRTSFAPNLGVRISDNVGDPDGPLGSCAVTVSGVNSTLSPTSGYFVAALNTVSDLSDGLNVRVAGPVNLANIPNPLPPTVPNMILNVTSPAQVFEIMDAMRISFGDGAAAPGDTAKFTAHYVFPANARVTADLEAFEGYHVWRSDLPDVDSFTLLGEIRQCESKFEFVLLGEDEFEENDVDLVYDPAARTFTVTDFDVHDDFPYRYAVSAFDRGFLGNDAGLTFEGPRTESGKLYPSTRARLPDREIYTVPNPYKRRADFQERGAKIVFANLPTQATIRIFNEAAEHLITLEHGPGQPRSTSPTSREWDLRTDSGMHLVPGIYIFHVQGTDRREEPVAGGGTQTVTENVEQTGKFVIVR